MEPVHSPLSNSPAGSLAALKSPQATYSIASRTNVARRYESTDSTESTGGPSAKRDEKQNPHPQPKGNIMGYEIKMIIGKAYTASDELEKDISSTETTNAARTAMGSFLYQFPSVKFSRP
jgi:hypothetical protein